MKKLRSGRSTKTGSHATKHAIDGAHRAHIRRIQQQVSKDLRAKYLKGQKEHGGRLWEKAGLLTEAYNEALDQVIYLRTLMDQQ